MELRRLAEPLSAEELATIRSFAFTNDRNSIDGQLWGRPGIKRLFATLDAAVSARQEAERVLEEFVKAFANANRDASAGYGWDALTKADSEARATLARTR